MDSSIYKILTQTEWDAFQEKRFFSGSSTDTRDGFIHFSSKEQIEGVLARYFAKQRPLYIVEFSVEDFGDSLRWEPTPQGEKFPHVYGRPLLIEKVLSTSIRGEE
jgi:uncharacterized protein (DUF952 family)